MWNAPPTRIVFARLIKPHPSTSRPIHPPPIYEEPQGNGRSAGPSWCRKGCRVDFPDRDRELSFQIVGAIILLAGMVVSRSVARMAVAMAERRGIDITLRLFLGNARLVVLGMFVVVALGNFGIELTPLVAAIGAAAFGLTLAIQGPVSRLSSGRAQTQSDRQHVPGQ